MSNRKRQKKVKKDSQLVIRINGEERDEFIALCEELDTSAARELRKFIRTFVKEHQTKEMLQDKNASTLDKGNSEEASVV